MKILLALLTTFSISSFAQESLKDQVINKKIQENISIKIQSLRDVDLDKISLTEYISNEESICLENAKDDEALESVCYGNTKRMNNIGDLETIIDLDIAKLTDYQSSIFFTLSTLYAISEFSPLSILALPIAIIADVITGPYWIYLLVSSGY